MQKYRQSGKTIVVCSHSMYMINELCTYSLWIDHGKIRENGKSEEVISLYLAYIENNKSTIQTDEVANKPQVEVLIEKIQLYDEIGDKISFIHQFSTVNINVDTWCFQELFYGHLAIIIEDQYEKPIFAALTRNTFEKAIKFKEKSSFCLTLPNIFLQRGSVWIKVLISDQHALRVIDEKRHGPYTIISNNPEFGLVWMEHKWSLYFSCNK